MVDLLDPDREKLIPVTWYMPSHGPEDFFSIPLPCDLKPFNIRRFKSGLQTCTTYSRQAYRPIADLLQPQGNWDPPQRAFHRISVIFPQTKIETVVVLVFPTWKRVSPVPSGVLQSSYNEVLDSYGYSLVSSATPSKFGNPPGYNACPAREFKRRGVWSEGQWLRIRPLFQTLIPCPSTLLIPESCPIRERALLWMYSKMNDNYYLACQNEGRCWRDLRSVLGQSFLKNQTSQQPKRMFRDSMTKTIELLKISIDVLDRALGSTYDQEDYQRLRREVSVTLSYEESRLGQVVLNINDEQNEMQMKLMAQQLKESRYMINQAISVGRLTKLAFIFVPLATVCSAFGMNVKEMDWSPSIWLFVVIAIFCTTIAVIVSSERARKSGKNMVGCLSKALSSPAPAKHDEKGDVDSLGSSA